MFSMDLKMSEIVDRCRIPAAMRCKFEVRAASPLMRREWVYQLNVHAFDVADATLYAVFITLAALVAPSRCK